MAHHFLFQGKGMETAFVIKPVRAILVLELGMVVSIFLFDLIKTLQNLPKPLTHFTDVDTEV